MPSVVPRHFLSLTKCTALTSHLAKNRGLFTESPDLLAAIQDLLLGSSPQNTKFSLWPYRGSISQSLYPLQTRMEQTALEQLRQYAGLMADPVLNRDGFRRTDVYWGFGDDPSLPLEGTKDLAPQRRELASQLIHLLDLVQKTPYQKMTLGRDVMSLLSRKADYSTFDLGAVSRQWGQSLHNPLLLAILHGFKLDQGRMMYGKVNKYNTVTVEYGDPCTYTQEAIMDNPWAAVERAFNAWQKDLPAKDPLKKKTFAQVSALAKPDLEKILSEEQLKELLINMSRSGATWGMMGFMKNNPSTLEHPAIQALIERFLLQPGALKATCAIDPEFPKMLSVFFTTHLDRLQGTKKISSYLFLHRLSRRVADLLPEKIAFPENLPLIRQWTEKAIQHNSSLAPMRK